MALSRCCLSSCPTSHSTEIDASHGRLRAEQFYFRQSQEPHPWMLLHQPTSILYRQDSRPDSGRGTSPLSVLSWPNQVPTAPFAPRPQTICPQGLAGYLDSYPGAPGPQKDSNLRLGWPETLERGEEHGKKSPVRAVTTPEKQPGVCCLKQATSLTQDQCP